MNKVALAAAGAVIGITLSLPAPALAQMTGDQISVKLAEDMEKFYGKPLNEARQFLRQQYGVSQPMKSTDNHYTFMVPMSDPLCGSVALDTDGNNVAGLQTMSWNRRDDNAYGQACEKAFSGK